ncbi:hypothetical protein IKF84_01985 [Candidatus Saccharibacteria bacterium]|nr:hypothetical protein [Candidatus Saccharibacteria bacterium]
MPEDNQTSMDNTTDQVNPSVADASTDTGADTSANLGMEDIDPNLKIPSLEDIEYATPSAYIDPDLPANPTPIEDPNEPEEVPEEEPETIEMTPEQIAEAVKASNEVMASVAEKIANSRNIIVALSSDPSVDELSSAIALSQFLGRLNKHAIAIYSGDIPSALQFLKPEDIFEKDADVMQDFVITLDKDKADHLRYKLDGDDVKIYITPYRDRIVSEDLGFSYGEYNVDLALTLNVSNGVDLDPALREYGTIMHDSTIVNITTGNPGKFGEVEWSNKFASSISEMVANLLLSAEGGTKIDAEEATALLTGIVAATDRFSRANTASSTMQTASKLMDAGADQQLVAANISDDLDNQFFAFSDSHIKKDAESNSAINNVEDVSISFEPTKEPGSGISEDGTALQISHGDDESSEEASKEPSEELSKEPENLEASEKPDEPEKSEESENQEEPKEPEASDSEEKAPEEPKAETSSTENGEAEKSSEPEKPENSALLDELKATEVSLSGVEPEASKEPDTTTNFTTEPATPEVAPALDSAPAPAPVEEFADATSKYSQMLTDALKEPTTPSVPTDSSTMASSLPPAPNPAAATAPAVSTPEVSNMPEINYGQTTSDILPPPPAPPVDINSPMPVPAPSSLPPTATNPSEPAPSTPSDASAFTIPTV